MNTTDKQSTRTKPWILAGASEPNSVGNEDYSVWNHVDGTQGWNDDLLQPYPAPSNDAVRGYFVEHGRLFVVPEPTSLLLTISGMVGIALYGMRSSLKIPRFVGAFLAVILLMVCNSASGATINEIRTASSDNDDVSNYFELIGTPGESLDRLSLLVVAGEDHRLNGIGEIATVISMAGHSIPSDGHFLATTTTTFYPETDLAIGVELFTITGTYLLVTDFSGARDDDLDSNNDGILDTTPWNEIVDAFSLIDGDENPDVSYGDGPVLGPVGNFPPVYLTRHPEGTGPWHYFADGFVNRSYDSPGVENLPVPEPSSLLLGTLALGGVFSRFTLSRANLVDAFPTSNIQREVLQ